MAHVSVAAEWQLVYDPYYKKHELYQMRWKLIDLSRNKVACAPFGGLIVVICDDSKIVQLYACKLRIFNSAGALISEMVWKNPGGRLIEISWSEDQTLIYIVQDSTIFRYNIHAELIEPNASIGKECFEENVVECVFLVNGVGSCKHHHEIGGYTQRCPNRKYFCVADFKTMKVCKLARPEIEELPHCVAVIEPNYTMTSNVEVFIGTDNKILMLDKDGVQKVDDTLVQKMAVSPNGNFAACFTHDGRLVVNNIDFNFTVIDEFCEVGFP